MNTGTLLAEVLGVIPRHHTPPRAAIRRFVCDDDDDHRRKLDELIRDIARAKALFFSERTLTVTLICSKLGISDARARKIANALVSQKLVKIDGRGCRIGIVYVALESLIAEFECEEEAAEE